MRDFNRDGVLVGRPDQDIFEESETQMYPIGMMHERHDRRFRYCQAYEAIGGTCRGLPDMAIVPGDTNGSTTGMETSLNTAAIVGDYALDVKNPGSTAFPIDEFVGGLMVVYSTGVIPPIWCARISGNDLFDATNGTIYIDEKVPVAVAASTMGVDIHPSRYKNVGTSGSGSLTLRTFVVVNHIDVTSEYFFWGQTLGPCWVTPNAFGSGRIKVFHSNGTITDRADGSISQIAGNAMMADYNGGYGDGVIDLRLE